MEIEFQTDVGKKRNTNQDYAGVFVNQAGMTLAILADGMGGHRAGDVASEHATEDIGAKWQETAITTPAEVSDWLVTAVQTENERIYQLGQEDAAMSGLGTTVVAAALGEEQFTIAHVGDSRAYLLRDQEIIQITEDHSLVNELVKSGEITKEMAAIHPRRNVLTRSVGMPGNLEVDVASHFFAENDYLLLASDGLTNMVPDELIAAVVFKEQPLKDKVQRLITLANEAGGVDNITVVLIAMGGGVHD